MRTLTFLLSMALVAIAARAEDAQTHTGAVSSGHVEVRYRPGSRAGASAPRVAAAAERDLRWICERLDVQPMGGLTLYLYDDVPALQALTGTTGNGGFSSGDAIHVPYDNDQTRRHEMVHMVAHQLPKTGEEERNGFFADGLANAVLEHVHGVHVHAVAAFYRERGTLPDLRGLASGDFYAWQRAHPKFNAYDVAGSFFRFLLDTYGAQRVKRYYTGTPVRQALGTSLAAAEKKWLAMLDAYETPPEVETLLRLRAGEAVGFESFTEALWKLRMGEESEWVSLMERELRPDGAGTWKRAGEAIVAANRGSGWSVCELGTETYGNCVVRVRIRTPSACPLQVRLGAENQAMLVNGTFPSRDDQPAAPSASASMTQNRRETDFVLVRLGDTIEIWIDGARALVAPAAGGPSPVGIGIYRGSASFEDLRVRRLP